MLQDDLHLPTLTVKETLSYAAWVKLPEGTMVGAREERVKFLLNMMGLEHVQDSPVGDAMQKVRDFCIFMTIMLGFYFKIYVLLQGISGGQMKRLSIAVEIVSLPSLIFFDGEMWLNNLLSIVNIEYVSIFRTNQWLGQFNRFGSYGISTKFSEPASHLYLYYP